MPATGPIAGAVQLGFADGAGRRLTAAVPLDGVLAGIAQAASRDPSNGGAEGSPGR